MTIHLRASRRANRSAAAPLFWQTAAHLINSPDGAPKGHHRGRATNERSATLAHAAPAALCQWRLVLPHAPGAYRVVGAGMCWRRRCFPMLGEPTLG